MSSSDVVDQDYEDYSATSSHYDATRRPVALHTVLGTLIANGRLDEQCVLSVGCGTGNYERVIGKHVAALHGVELCEKMLAKAQAKCADLPNVSFTQGDMCDLHFIPDNSMDCVYAMQTLHHLPSFEHVERAVREFFRVLKPGGVFVANVTFEEQMRNGYWYASLIPEAIERFNKKVVQFDEFSALFKGVGFTDVRRVVDLDETLRAPEAEQRLDGPSDASWRAGDSIWSLVDPCELKRCIAQVGTLSDAWFDQTLKQCAQVGQATTVVTKKPL